ncbi:MAG: hypothetical protein J6031_06100 [Bacteroidales bacterium]|nr:hypothetical protein [Bacteroidales bacterium]
MKRFIRILSCTLALVAIAMTNNANAQSNIMYGSSRNPLMNSANPAFFPSHARAYLALPNVNFNLSSPLAYSSIFNYDSVEQRTFINANKILDSLSNGEQMRLGTNIHALGLGIDFGKFFLTLSAQAKVDFGFGMPKGLVTFINDGNYNHTGDDVIELLDGNLIGARVYGEGALGFGIRLNDYLTVGARVKMLLGYLDLSNAGSSLTMTTAPDYSSLRADMNLNMNYTSAIDITTDTNTNQTSATVRTYMPKNLGINFDLGARYATDLFEVSASIVDLGPGIHWTDGIKRIVSARDDNSFTFTGVNVSNIMQGGTLDSSYTQVLIDSLTALAEYKTIDGGDAYWTAIPTKVNLGGMLHITPGVSAGLLFHGEFDRGLVKVGDVFKTKTVGFYSRTSAIARVNIHEWVEVVASASVLTNNGHWNWFNPGIGFTLTPFRAFQIYAFLDYISNFYVIDAKEVNLSVGLNLFFGSGSTY